MKEEEWNRIQNKMPLLGSGTRLHKQKSSKLVPCRFSYRQLLLHVQTLFPGSLGATATLTKKEKIVFSQKQIWLRHLDSTYLLTNLLKRGISSEIGNLLAIQKQSDLV